MSNQPITLRPLNTFNPLDHARLLGWLFFQPRLLTLYRRQQGEHSTRQIGTWLTSTLLWLPVLIPITALTIGALPSHDLQLSLPVMLAAILLGWLITALLGSLEYPTARGWRHAFGPVYDSTFIIVFGLAFGVAFGMAFLSGLDFTNIITIYDTLGHQGFTALLAAFALAFGLAYIVADNIAFGGAFVFTPIIAMCATGLLTFGIGYVGVFASVFVMTFAISFMVSAIIMFLLASLIVNKLERHPDSGLGRTLRAIGLSLLVLAHLSLIWICLFGGWQLLRLS